MSTIAGSQDNNPLQHLFLGDGGEMGLLIRAYDWSKSPFGAPADWPQSLRTTVRLMLTSRHPMFIWWGSELIQLYNDAYRATMGPERHPQALGQRGRECWAEIWPIIGPQIDLVMRGEGSTWHEDQLVPMTRHGQLQNVWWTYGYSPIDHEGGVGGVLVVCNDVTEEHLAKDALARANAQLSTDVERLHSMFSQAPGFIAVMRGSEHIFDFTNAAYDRLIGRSDVLGRRVLDVLPEVEAQGFVSLLDHVFVSGTRHVGENVSIVLQRAADGPPDRLYVDFLFEPIRGPDGAVTGIFVAGHDVTARLVAEHRQKLLSDEMQHRVKNVLATVQSLASLTAKTADSIGDFQSQFATRIQAMSRTHDVLMRGHDGNVRLRVVLSAELRPYMGAQVELECVDIEIGSAEAISLTLLVHELLTNAAKYGALSTSNGKLSVNCCSFQDGAILMWRETTPDVRTGGEMGFGTVLIERLATALNGIAKLEMRENGLAADIMFKPVG